MRIASVMAATGLLAAATAASADFLAIELDFEYSGATAPSGSGPWLRAEFNSTTPGEVQLKLISLLNSSTEKVKDWGFNFDPSLNATNLSVSQESGPAATWSTGTNHWKAGGNGWYDLRFSFSPSSDLFKQGSVAEFTITSTDPISAHSFMYQSVNGPPSKNGFYSAAHVLGIYVEESGWIAPSGPPEQVLVPLPAPVALGGAGLALAAGVSIRRRR